MKYLLVKTGMATITKIINAINGGEAKKMIENLVYVYETKDLTNDEKRKAVRDAVTPYVKIFAQWAIDTAILFAVNAMKVQFETLQKMDGKS